MALPEREITKDMFEPAEIDHSKSEEISGKSIGYWQDAYRRLKENKGAVVSAIVIAFIVVMSIIGPYMNDYGSNDQELVWSNLPPRVSFLDDIHWLPFDGQTSQGVSKYQMVGAEAEYFWFGTDDLGRDLWTRVWLGTRISLLIGLVAAVVDLIIGVAYGGISGYFGGKTDLIMQRIIDVLIGIPMLVWVILLLIVLKGGILAVMLSLALANWIGQARIVRGEIFKLKQEEYTLAAKSLGGNHARIITKHLIPNAIGIIIINTMFMVPAAIFFEAFLSFVGLGISPPQASLGSIINEGYKVMTIHPYAAIIPGAIISVLLIAFNLFGDGLRDSLDPKLRQ